MLDLGNLDVTVTGIKWPTFIPETQNTVNPVFKEPGLNAQMKVDVDIPMQDEVSKLVPNTTVKTSALFMYGDPGENDDLKGYAGRKN